MNEKKRPALAGVPRQDRFAVCRSNLIAVFGFSLINVLLAAAGANMYFLFSATLPYYLAIIGHELIGESAAAAGVVIIAVAVVICLLYLLAWWRSKKKPGWIIAALVFFVIDTIVLLLGMAVIGPGNLIFDILFHVLVLYYLISGIVAWAKAGKAPKQETVQPAELWYEPQPAGSWYEPQPAGQDDAPPAAEPREAAQPLTDDLWQEARGGSDSPEL